MGVLTIERQALLVAFSGLIRVVEQRAVGNLLIAGLGYWLNRRFQVRHDVAGPSAMIGASNFFELAVAVAIVLYGFNSGAALATVVGVLIEVPVMLSVVRIVNRSRPWYEQGARMPNHGGRDSFARRSTASAMDCSQSPSD